jgi:hypothetical protein
LEAEMSYENPLHPDGEPERPTEKAPIDRSLITPVIHYLVEESFNNAAEHGWWDEERSFGDLIALMHSELSEALEHYRDGADIGKIHWTGENEDKPDGVAVEFADVLIRIFDAVGFYGIPLAEALAVKLEYNRTRPFKHGGRVM